MTLMTGTTRVHDEDKELYENQMPHKESNQMQRSIHIYNKLEEKWDLRHGNGKAGNSKTIFRTSLSDSRNENYPI